MQFEPVASSKGKLDVVARLQSAGLLTIVGPVRRGNSIHADRSGDARSHRVAEHHHPRSLAAGRELPFSSRHPASYAAINQFHSAFISSCTWQSQRPSQNRRLTIHLQLNPRMMKSGTTRLCSNPGTLRFKNTRYDLLPLTGSLLD